MSVETRPTYESDTLLNSREFAKYAILLCRDWIDEYHSYSRNHRDENGNRYDPTTRLVAWLTVHSNDIESNIADSMSTLNYDYKDNDRTDFDNIRYEDDEEIAKFHIAYNGIENVIDAAEIDPDDYIEKPDERAVQAIGATLVRMEYLSRVIGKTKVQDNFSPIYRQNVISTIYTALPLAEDESDAQFMPLELTEDNFPLAA